MKTIKTHGIPQLGDRRGSQSVPSESENHMIASIYQPKRGFVVLNDRQLLTERQCAIWPQKLNSGLSWTESDIQGYVKQVVSDIIGATGLADTLECFNELSVFKFRPGTSFLTSDKPQLLLNRYLGGLDSRRPCWYN